MHFGKVYRFGPTPEHPANHLFVFLPASGADARSMIPAAFKFQGRFPSAALVVPSGFASYESDRDCQQWYSSRGLNDDNRMQRISAILPRIEALVRREQTNYRVPGERTVLIGYAQGGTVALETVKSVPGLAGAAVAARVGTTAATSPGGSVSTPWPPAVPGWPSTAGCDPMPPPFSFSLITLALPYVSPPSWSFLSSTS